MRMNVCFIALVLILTANTLFGQQWKSIRHEFIQNISLYRSELLLQDKEQLFELQSVIDSWIKCEPDEEELVDLVYLVNTAVQVYNMNFKRIYKVVNKNLPDSEIARQLKEKDVDIIRKNPDLIDLVLEGVLSYDYPYALVENESILKELEFYNFRSGDVIGEVGAGNGMFSFLLGILGIDLSVSINEIDIFRVQFINNKFERNKDKIKFNSVEIIKGKKKDTHFNKLHDIIIVRNSFHHFKKKEAMLQSIKASLKVDGVLFIHEYLRDEHYIDDSCGLHMLEKDIRSLITENGYRLTDEIRLGKVLILKCNK